MDISHTLACLILRKILWDGLYDPHFIGEEMEVTQLVTDGSLVWTQKSDPEAGLFSASLLGQKSCDSQDWSVLLLYMGD